MKRSKTTQIVDNIFVINPLLHKNLIKPEQLNSTLTPGLHFILMILKQHSELSMTEISKIISMPKPNVTTLVDKLIADNLVERHPDPSDRRIIKIKLTKNGDIKINEVQEKIKMKMKENLSVLSKDEIEQLAESLESLKNILVKIFTK